MVEKFMASYASDRTFYPELGDGGENEEVHRELVRFRKVYKKICDFLEASEDHDFCLRIEKLNVKYMSYFSQLEKFYRQRRFYDEKEAEEIVLKNKKLLSRIRRIYQNELESLQHKKAVLMKADLDVIDMFSAEDEDISKKDDSEEPPAPEEEPVKDHSAEKSSATLHLYFTELDRFRLINDWENFTSESTEIKKILIPVGRKKERLFVYAYACWSEPGWLGFFVKYRFGNDSEWQEKQIGTYYVYDLAEPCTPYKFWISGMPCTLSIHFFEEFEEGNFSW